MDSVCDGILRASEMARPEREIGRQLQLASTNFEPIQVFLDQLGERLANQDGPSAALERRGGMQPTAKNTFEVQYSLRLAGDRPLSLTFIVTGANAELIVARSPAFGCPRYGC